MASVGIDDRTGSILVGWPRIAHSIRTIVMTEIGERVQRRDFGSKIPALVDRPQNQENVVDFFMAIVEALEPRLQPDGRWYGEPCFAVTVLAADLSTPGHVRVEVSGVEYPNGHQQDFSSASERRFAIDFT